jgi:hypothetical protein
MGCGCSLAGEFLGLWRRKQAQQWEVWACGTDHDLGPVDGELHAFCREHGEEIAGIPGRPGEVLHRRATRTLVDCRPDIAAVQNWIDRAVFAGGPDSDPSPQTLRDRVLKLIRLRNAGARDLGFASYPELVAWDEELDLKRVCQLAAGVVRAEKEQRTALMARYGAHGLGDWFACLSAVAPAHGEVDIDACCGQLLRELGLENAREHLHIETRTGGAAGFVLECGANDIRMFLRPSPDPMLLFHELGHYLGRSLSRESGVFRLLPASTDEAFAAVLEAVAMVTNTVNDLYGEAVEDARRAFQSVGVLENARLHASFTFEMSLWEGCSKPEQRYRECYAEVGIDVGDEEQWPLDSFRSLDPVYVQNYIVGRLVADSTVEYLRAEVHPVASPAWGEWLAMHYYRDGAVRSLTQKTRALGAYNPLRAALNGVGCPSFR